jgi:hypothetical protein
VIDAQPVVGHGDAKSDGVADADADADVVAASLKVELVTLRDLRERDFGSAEGEKFGAGIVGADAESREQMRVRAERFVREHLAPLLTAEWAAAGGCVVVVAHGLILDSLLRELLVKFGPAEMAFLGNPRMVGWSNTGYAELLVRVGQPGKSAAREGLAGEVSGERTSDSAPALVSLPQQPRITLSLVAANVLKHLEGLKKTRGGIGSAQFDKRQRTVDSFFGPATKKAKVERGLEVEASLHPSTQTLLDGCDTELGEFIFLFTLCPAVMMRETKFTDLYRNTMWKHLSNRYLTQLLHSSPVCIDLGFQMLTVGKPQVRSAAPMLCEWLIPWRKAYGSVLPAQWWCCPVKGRWRSCRWPLWPE